MGAESFMSDVLGHLIGEYSSAGALVASRREGLFVDAMGVRSMISCDEPKGIIMDNHVYKTIQITGTSNSSADEAVRTAVDRAGKTIHNLRWFRVTDTRGHIDNQ